MRREECISNVKDIMVNKNPYGKYHKQNFDAYGYYGEMTPINSSIVMDMPATVVLSSSVYDALKTIRDVTNETNQEFAFFLYGQEIQDNVIEFTRFVTSGMNRQSTEASFDQTLVNDLQNQIGNNRNNGFVVAHGHSHPPIGQYYENFSLGDFASYMQMNENNSTFKNREVELVGCLVVPSGDINFVFYDNVNKNFYRITNVYVKNMDGSYSPVNTYGMNQEEQIIK